MVAALLLVGWTAFVWGTRISNALDDRSLSGSAQAATLLTAGAMVALAGWLGVTAVRRGEVRRPLLALSVATALVWVVRVPSIVLADHAVGFTVVHVGLAVVSIGLVALAWRSVGGRPSVATGASRA